MATGFDFNNIGSIFGGGMGGTPSGLDALLSEDQRKLLGRNAALSAAGALLQASGRSAVPISMGQALGSALQAGQQGYQQARVSSLQDLLLGQKLQEAKTAQELQTLTDAEVLVLEGGNPAWVKAGLELEKGPSHLASPPLDRYKRPYEGTNVDPAAMQAYLDWEFGLVEQLGKDGTHHFWVL